MKPADLDALLTQVAGILASIKTNVTLTDIQLVQPLIPLLDQHMATQEASSIANMLTQACTAGTALLTPRADGTLLIDALISMATTVQSRPLEEDAIALLL